MRSTEPPTIAEAPSSVNSAPQSASLESMSTLDRDTSVMVSVAVTTATPAFRRNREALRGWPATARVPVAVHREGKHVFNELVTGRRFFLFKGVRAAHNQLRIERGFTVRSCNQGLCSSGSVGKDTALCRCHAEPSAPAWRIYQRLLPALPPPWKQDHRSRQ